MSIRERDTGFPEPFCGNRNTSLHHPDAIVGPDACIGEEDVMVWRANARHRLSFQARQERFKELTVSPIPERRDSMTSEDGAFSALGRLAAITSLRSPRIGLGVTDAMQPRPTDLDSVVSSGLSSSSSSGGLRSPGSSPSHPSTRKFDPRDGRNPRDPRDERPTRRRSFIARLMHR